MDNEPQIVQNQQDLPGHSAGENEALLEDETEERQINKSLSSNQEENIQANIQALYDLTQQRLKLEEQLAQREAALNEVRPKGINKQNNLADMEPAAAIKKAERLATQRYNYLQYLSSWMMSIQTRILAEQTKVVKLKKRRWRKQTRPYDPKDALITRDHSELNKMLEKKIVLMVETQPSFSCEELRDILNKDTAVLELSGKQITKTKVQRVLTQAGFQRKNVNKFPLNRFAIPYMQQKTIYSEKVNDYLSNGYVLYFLDEMLYSIYPERQYAWMRVDRKLNPTNVFDIKSQPCLSFMSIITSKRVASWKINIQPLSEELLYESLQTMMTDILKKSKEVSKEKRRVLIMNEYQEHNKLICEKFIEEYQFEVIMMPPFSHASNAAFLFAKELKKKMRLQSCKEKKPVFEEEYQQEDRMVHMENNIQMAIKTYKKHMIPEFYTKAMKHIKQGFYGEKY